MIKLKKCQTKTRDLQTDEKEEVEKILQQTRKNRKNSFTNWLQANIMDSKQKVKKKIAKKKDR